MLEVKCAVDIPHSTLCNVAADLEVIELVAYLKHVETSRG
jgi:hypothetical protein